MKQASHVSSDRAAKDVPRAGFSCASYLAGHTVHYVPVLKRAPQLTPVEATLEVKGDRLRLSLREMSSRVWSHNRFAVASLVEELGSTCFWFPTLSLARWTVPDVRHWVSLSLEPTGPCISVEEARLAEFDISN